MSACIMNSRTFRKKTCVKSGAGEHQALTVTIKKSSLTCSLSIFGTWGESKLMSRDRITRGLDFCE